MAVLAAGGCADVVHLMALSDELVQIMPTPSVSPDCVELQAVQGHQVLRGHACFISSLAFASHGDLLVSGVRSSLQCGQADQLACRALTASSASGTLATSLTRQPRSTGLVRRWRPSHFVHTVLQAQGVALCGRPRSSTGTSCFRWTAAAAARSHCMRWAPDRRHSRVQACLQCSVQVQDMACRVEIYQVVTQSRIPRPLR